MHISKQRDFYLSKTSFKKFNLLIRLVYLTCYRDSPGSGRPSPWASGHALDDDGGGADEAAYASCAPCLRPPLAPASRTLDTHLDNPPPLGCDGPLCTNWLAAIYDCHPKITKILIKNVTSCTKR